jgi:hypothetical protein
MNCWSSRSTVQTKPHCPLPWSGGVVAFNIAEGWSEDVSENVARELRRRYDLQMCELPASISDFVGRHEDADGAS